MATDLHIRVLGALVLERDGEPLPDDIWRSQQERRLLAILLARRGKRTTTEQLIEWLWPAAEPAAASLTLRSAISSLRRTLEPTTAARASRRYIITTSGGYAWNTAADAWIDVEAFLALANSTASPIDAAGAERLEQAVELYRGDFLEDEPEAAWMLGARERLRDSFIRSVELLAAYRHHQGDYAAALAILRRGLVFAPLCEPLWRRLIQSQHTAGDTAGALGSYEHYRLALDRELGALPSAATQALHTAILRGEAMGSPPPARAAHSAPSVSATHAVPALIGRTQERELLRERIRRLAQRRGTTIAIVGEAGIGKSRLALEAVREAVDAGAQAIVLRCAPLERELPFAPLGEPLRRIVRAAPDELLRRLPASSMAQLAELLPALHDRLPHLPAVPPAPPAERRNQLLGALTELALLLARGAPLVVLCDDAHWADEATLALLGRLAHRAPRHAVLLLVAYRSEELADNPALHTLLRELSRELLLASLLLGPLDQEETAHLIAALGRVTPQQLAGLTPRIATQTGGNPLFVTLAVQSMLERHAVPSLAPLLQARNNGALLPEPRGMPAIRELVLSRLARLPAPARDLAEQIAVIGRAVSLDLIEQLGDAGLPAAHMLLERQLLVEGADGRIGFAHDLVRSVVADALPSPRQRLLHRRAAGALVALYGQQPERAAEIAHHLARAGRGQDSELLRTSITAGDEARRTLALNAALEHYATALVAANRLDLAAPVELVHRAFFGRLLAYESLLDWDGVAETSRAYEQWALRRPAAPPVLVAPQRLVLLRALTGDLTSAAQMSRQHRIAGGRAAPLLQDLMQRTALILQPAEEAPRYNPASCHASSFEAATKPFSTAAPPGQPAAELPASLGDEEAAALLFQFGWALLAQGLQRDARPCLERAYQLALATGQPAGAVASALQMAHLHALTGDAATSQHWLALSLNTAEKAPQAAWLSIWPRIHQGFLWLQNDKHDQAYERFAGMAQQLQRLPSFQSHRASVETGLGLVALRRGNHHEARQRLAEALSEHGALYGFVYVAAQHGLARLAALAGNSGLARHVLSHALEYSRRRHLLPEYGHTALELARLERDNGAPQQVLTLLDHVIHQATEAGLAALASAALALRQRIDNEAA
jgi:DNA-binding SARP family transcriptional activator